MFTNDVGATIGRPTAQYYVCAEAVGKRYILLRGRAMLAPTRKNDNKTECILTFRLDSLGFDFTP